MQNAHKKKNSLQDAPFYANAFCSLIRPFLAVPPQFALYNARDLEGFMSLFAEDAVAMDAETDQILGKVCTFVCQQMQSHLIFDDTIYFHMELGNLCF